MIIERIQYDTVFSAIRTIDRLTFFSYTTHIVPVLFVSLVTMIV